MNIAIAGGTGFIGKVIIKKLVKAGHHVVALIRPGSLLKIASFSGTESSYIYYDPPSPITKVLDGCEAVINLVGIIKETKETSFEFAHHLIPMLLVKAAQIVGIKRFLHISALGTAGNLDTEYMETKRLGENVVKSSGLDYTIFRPSVVFGQEDKFVNFIAKVIKFSPIFPVIGDGKYRLQPISVDDVAEGFVRSIDKPRTIGKTYDVAGLDKYTFDEMLDIIGLMLGKNKVRKFHQPVGLVKFKARLYGCFLPIPITVDMINMLLAENISNDFSFLSDLDITPINFAEGIKKYLT